MPNNSQSNWNNQKSFSEICRRAGGRRAHNLRRKLIAAHRLRALVVIIKELNLEWGWQTKAASRLGVDRSTICRDFKKLQAMHRERQSSTEIPLVAPQTPQASTNHEANYRAEMHAFLSRPRNAGLNEKQNTGIPKPKRQYQPPESIERIRPNLKPFLQSKIIA